MNKSAPIIHNDWGHKITPSQQKWLDKMLASEREILNIALTKGGYISVTYKSLLKDSTYPYKCETRGIRAGWICSESGREYDPVLLKISNGICDDHVLGIRKI